jgi:hypothetical protein
MLSLNNRDQLPNRGNCTGTYHLPVPPVGEPPTYLGVVDDVLKLDVPLPARNQDRADPLNTGEYICSKDPCGPIFSPQMFCALEKASKRFWLQTYVKELSPGEHRVVVLAGESHLKGSKAGAAGVALLEAFPVRGLEGVTLNKTMCDRVLQTAMAPYFALLKSAKRSQGGIRGSSIYKAKEIDALDAHGTPVPTTNLRLEAGELPVTVLGETSKILTATPFIITELFLLRRVVGLLPVYGEVLQRTLTTVLTHLEQPVNVAMIGLLASTLIPRRWCHNSALAAIRRTLGVQIEWLIEQRNELMVHNLLEHAEGSEYRSPVLALVGALHVRGMGHQLEKRGWKKMSPPYSGVTN